MRIARVRALSRGRVRTRLFAIVLLAAVLPAAGMSIAGAQAPSVGGVPNGYQAIVIKAPDQDAFAQWGSRMVEAGDLDRDGVPDLYVSAYDFHVPGSQAGGRIYAVSGKSLVSGGSPKVLYRLDSSEKTAVAEYGFGIAALEKATGKKKPLLAVGANKWGPANEGKVQVFEGSKGRLLYTLDNPGKGFNGRFGSRIGRAGDLNGDGISELIVGAPGNSGPKGCKGSPAPTKKATSVKMCRNQGQTFVFNGKNGKLMRTLDLPSKDRDTSECIVDCVQFGLAVQGIGDINGDKVIDQQVAAARYSFCPKGSAECRERQGRIYLFSGKTGKLIKKIDDPKPQAGAHFGFQDAKPLAPGDLNGDRVPEIYGNGFLQDGSAGKGQGTGWVLNGKTGKKLIELPDPTPGSGALFGWTMARTNFNGDKTPDLLIGSAPHGHGPPVSQPDGGLAVFDGKSGKVLAEFNLPEEFRAQRVRPATAMDSGFETAPALGWSLASPGDLNGDGKDDYVAGAPGTDVDGRKSEGILVVFLSSSSPDENRRG